MTKNISGEAICAVDYSFRRIGGKYKGRILWYLNSFTVLRFGELRRKLSDITPKMMTQALRELEEDELIQRKVYVEVPPKVEYTLSEKGLSIMPVMEALCNWGHDHIGNFDNLTSKEDYGLTTKK